MKNIFAPWRMDYILSKKPNSSSCIFCLDGFSNQEISLAEAERLVVYKGKEIFIMLNKYPYANGHLMLLPYRHLQDFTLLSATESAEMMLLMQKSCLVLEKECKPDGINMGINLGKAAGAGIAEHLHFHIVPRWEGDSQFLAVTSDTRLIPELLPKTQKRFELAFKMIM